MKKSFLLISCFLLSILFTFSIFAQEVGVKDSYTGTFIKNQTPLTQGHNIPLPYDGPLDVLFDNGPMVTHPGGGYGGADASALQTALGMGTYGFGAQVFYGYFVADDFTITGDAWDISEIDFYAYQTGSGTTPTINAIHVAILDGPPDAGGNIIAGDLTTNVLTSASFTNIYRVLDTDLLNNQRPVMKVTVIFGTPINLNPGTYWLQWQFDGTLSSGPWQPPVTVLGQTGSGNALQYTTAWAPIIDVGPQDLPFMIMGTSGPPVGPGQATDPNPANGATDVDINQDLGWTNPAGATSIEVFFGTSPGSLTSIYSGSPVSTYDQGTMDYLSTYFWRVDETDASGTTNGAVWSFTTMQNPSIITAPFYPQNADYWTGTTDQVTKTDVSEVRTLDPEMGWMTFDISAIEPYSQILSIEFWGYVNNTYYPYWSVTPMGTVNPVTDDATTITAQLLAGYAQGTAYVYSDESSTFAPGWHNYMLETTAVPDLQAAVDAGQGWFAIGIVDRDFSTTYFINFDGWAQTNVPYINIEYVPIPVELTSFTANVVNGNVQLNWSTATETNNKGFEVQRSSGGEYQTLAFIQGNGTSTQQHAYAYSDQDVANGNYSYRLRQVDFDGSSEFSQVVEVAVNRPVEYNLAQNYPNPFNPSTKINYGLKVDSKVTLKVFDILGQEVVTLLNENIAAGNHTVTFDASKLNSGVYLYKIEANGVDGSSFTSVKKMILTK